MENGVDGFEPVWMSVSEVLTLPYSYHSQYELNMWFFLDEICYLGTCFSRGGMIIKIQFIFQLWTLIFLPYMVVFNPANLTGGDWAPNVTTEVM